VADEAITAPKRIEALTRIQILKLHLVSFFNSNYYPPVTALLVLIGHVSGLELYLAAINVLLACLALISCPTFKPLLTFMLTFVYQITLKHSPGIPTFSSYYFEGARLVLVIFLAVALFSSIIYFLIKRVFPKIKHDTPLLLPLIILSAAFLFSGAFSPEWSLPSFLLSLVEIVGFFLFFYMIYYGFDGEDTQSLISHLCYVSLLCALVLIGEIAFMYLTYDNLFTPDGSVVKEAINLGWGIWNPIGFALCTPIPFLVFGAQRAKSRIMTAIYTAASVLTFGAAVLTLSRNALIFSALALAASFIFCAFTGKKRTYFRIMTLIGILCVILGAAIFREKITSILSDLFERGLSDNGRFELWRVGIENFLSNPIFGTGLFGYGETDTVIAASFLPTMAHNTVVELLSAMGIFGLISYTYYRVMSLKPFFVHPSKEKFMLLFPILIALLMSLLDNFVFYFYTMFYYTVALAIAHKISDEESMKSIDINIDINNEESHRT